MVQTRLTRAQARSLPSVLAVSFFLATFVFGCAGSGTGCSTLQPIPTGRYQGPKNDNAVNLRLSKRGVDYLNSNLELLVGMFAPGNIMTFPVNCTQQSFNLGSLLGSTDVYIADQGRAGGSGRMDKNCTNDDPATITATITSFALVPQPTDKLAATVTMQIAAPKLYVLIDSFCDLKCSIAFNSARANTADNVISAVVQFTIDTKWDRLLAFKIASIEGTQVCGGGSSPPNCVDPSDLSFNSEVSSVLDLCSYACDVLDISAVKNFVLSLLSPRLQTQVEQALAAQTCQTCVTAADCPKSTDGANTQATCTNKVCTDPMTNKCTPRFLGTEGRLDLGGLLGTFGVPAGAQLDVSLAAGSSVNVDQGLSLGTRAGLMPVLVSSCVPPAAAPPITAVVAPDFDAEAMAGSTYHVGLGVSANFLNSAFWAAQQAGALCLNLSTDNVGLLDTGLFKTLLPSLGPLATRDGKDAPMMIVLRPGRPPSTVVGLGTYDPITKKPIAPLLTLTLSDLNLDFYALLDDRFVRLFTITADVALPFSLIFEGCDKVTPALADLKTLITNIRTTKSELLAEDPQVLAGLLPTVIGLAEPALAKGLKGFALPTLGNFKLKVSEAKGLGLISGSQNYHHLGLYAQLLPPNGTCAVSAPQLTASLRRSRMPRHEDMRLDGRHPLPVPEAVLDVRAFAKEGTPEFSYQVDDGLWTDFAPAHDGTLVVAHPRFVLQGVHAIAVRARVAEDPHGISAPVTVGFVSDFDPPELTLSPEPARDQLVVNARDVVTPVEGLLFSYRVGQGEFGAFGPARPIKLSAVDAQGGAAVRAQDALGNIAEAVYRAPVVSLRGDAPSVLAQGADAPRSTGCAAVPGLELVGLGLVVLLARRRQP